MELDSANLHTDLYIWVMKLKTFLEADKVVLWLSTPNNALENRTPISLIREGKSEELRKMIVEFKERAFLSVAPSYEKNQSNN
jgi:uncharacterized protein (DUF2384 family)